MWEKLTIRSRKKKKRQDVDKKKKKGARSRAVKNEDISN